MVYLGYGWVLTADGVNCLFACRYTTCVYNVMVHKCFTKRIIIETTPPEYAPILPFFGGTLTEMHRMACCPAAISIVQLCMYIVTLIL